MPPVAVRPCCCMHRRQPGGQRMIRTEQQYGGGIRDGRVIGIGGDRVRDVTTLPMFKPLPDIRARIHGMQHDTAHAPVMTYHDGTGGPLPVGCKLRRCCMDDLQAYQRRRPCRHVLSPRWHASSRIGRPFRTVAGSYQPRPAYAEGILPGSLDSLSRLNR